MKKNEKSKIKIASLIATLSLSVHHRIDAQNENLDLEEVNLFDSMSKYDKKEVVIDQGMDDLEEIKNDTVLSEAVGADAQPATEKVVITPQKVDFFDTGAEEKNLLKESKLIKGKISKKDWDDLAIKARSEKYEVQKGDYLWKISKNLFGSGFYYSKIWSLNPQITNPHEVEPGTVLTFTTGDFDSLPTIEVGEFTDTSVSSAKKGSSYSNSNDKSTPPWILERKKLIDQGVYFQFASEETYEDLEKLENQQRTNEWEKYSPPLSEVEIVEPTEEYDDSGFDKNSKISFNYKEGFFLNTFVTTNIISDLGEVVAAKNESVFIHKFDTIFVRFDKGIKVRPGDLFSVYTFGGEAKHKISDRQGFIYSTTAQIKILEKKDDLWVASVVDQSGIVQRKDRITVYTPRINKITKNFGKRSVEAAIIATYRDTAAGISFGDVVYLDRGRADGVELGNVFEVQSFVDKGTNKKISSSPAYKTGELTVINVTDNFATALVSHSAQDLQVGNLAFMKSEENALRDSKLKNKSKLKDLKKVEHNALDEIDVELHLDEVGADILNKADRIQLSEDEIEELDRQEKEKSIIRDSNRDVKELDKLESEILDSEKLLDEGHRDEDKLLEQENLNLQDKKNQNQDLNAFESLNEIEHEIGKKYLDEDINNKENPYGLTEFDLEEVDEMLNTGSKKEIK